MDSPILQTKLIIPHVHPHLVSRARLSDQIESGIAAGHQLTLVAAPAGFGKTTAVSTWLHQNNKQSSWLSLEDSDNETGVFWMYILASIRTVLPDFAETAFAALTRTPPAPISSLLPIITNELSCLSEPLVLALDDYHVIDNQEIHDQVSFLMKHRPRQFHIVIATRADPPLPVARLRAQRSLTELRAEDLRFTEDEAKALLNGVMQLGLSSADIHLLESRTEGWGVGLLLAAQSIQGRSDKSEFISAITGSQHYILEYLIEEVLNRQSDQTRKFLLQTSILDRLCGQLCDAVTDQSNGEETIQQLSKANLFIVPLDQDHIWYRYHHLFSALLMNLLQKEFSEEDILQLHRKASFWYQDADDLDKAIRFALKGQDFERAAYLIEQIVDKVIARGQVKTLLRWIGAIPEDVINSRPRLLMHQGWVVFLSGKVTLSSQIFQRAKHVLTNIPGSDERDLLYGRLSAMQSTITALTRDLRSAIAQAQEALAILPEKEFIFRARASRVLGVCYMFQGKFTKALEFLENAKLLALGGQNKFLASEILSQIGTLRKHQAKLSLARDAYQQILDLYTHPEVTPPACLGYIGLAEIYIEQNNLQDAEDYLNKGIELCQQGNIGYALQPAYLIGGLLRYARGDQAGAIETIQKGDALSRFGGGSLESILGLAWFHTRLYLGLGDLEKARDWAEGKLLPHSRTFDNMPPVLDEMHQSLLARVYLRFGEFEKTLEICERVCTQAKTGDRLARVIELDLFKAMTLHKLGKSCDAYDVFEDCITLAEPEGFVRLFLEAGNTVVDLLQMAKGRHHEYVHKLLTAFNIQQAKTGTNTTYCSGREELVESLTERELDVLRLMCEGHSNQDIADEMVVSVNTIKKHTSNIYGKLGVRNRAQAVLRAREIELV